MRIEGFHREMPRWLHATFRTFGEIGVQAYIHTHKYTHIYMYAHRQREEERER